MDYTTLIAAKTVDGSIRRWMNYDALDVVTIVQEAMGFVNLRLRVPAMRKDWTGTIALDATTLAFPPDFVEELWFGHTYPGRGRIRGKIPADLMESRSYNETTGILESGEPARYWLGSDPPVARLNVRADRAYNVALVYLAQLVLDGTTTENWVTKRHPRIIRCACLGMANEWMKRDGEKEYWLQKAEAEIMVVNIRHEMELKAMDHVVGGGTDG